MATQVPSDNPRFSNLNPVYYLPVFLLATLFACHDEPRHERKLASVPHRADTATRPPVKKPLKKTVAAVKKVKVAPPKTEPAAEPAWTGKKRIYLTFDDGPNQGTQNVLDIVRAEAIPATFFIVGEHVFASHHQTAVWDSLKATPSIELCNHSFTHAHNRYAHFYETPAAVVEDIEMTKNRLLPENNIVRAPGRNSWRIDSLRVTDIRKSAPAIDSLQKAGFMVLGWDLEWHYDPKTFQVENTAESLLGQIDSVFKKGRTRYPGNLVLLAHDQVYKSAADSTQLRELIRLLKSRPDYELALVSSYPPIDKKLVTMPKPVTDTAANRPGPTDSARLKPHHADSLAGHLTH